MSKTPMYAGRLLKRVVVLDDLAGPPQEGYEQALRLDLPMREVRAWDSLSVNLE